jgi:hypothetical protein
MKRVLFLAAALAVFMAGTTTGYSRMIMTNDGRYVTTDLSSKTHPARTERVRVTSRGYAYHRSGLRANEEIAVVGHRSSTCAHAVGGLSCGCDTARYFGVRISVHRNGKHDLDLASNWRYLKQSSGPCVGCAAWRSGHVMAIVGGRPGAWEVMDFNSGHGRTHSYTVARFPGYRFAVPADLQLNYSRHRSRTARLH